MYQNIKTWLKSLLNQMNPQKSGQDGGPGAEGGPAAGKTPKKLNIFNIIIVIFLINIVLNFIAVNMSGTGMQIEYSQFIKLVESGNAGRVQIEDDTIKFTLMDGFSNENGNISKRLDILPSI